MAEGNELLERYPMGSCWADFTGDRQIVTGMSDHGGLRTVEVTSPHEGDVRDHHWRAGAEERFTPWVEPVPAPDFEHSGWVHPTTQSVRSGYTGPLPHTPEGREFAYGVLNGELFIHWTAE